MCPNQVQNLVEALVHFDPCPIGDREAIVVLEGGIGPKVHQQLDDGHADPAALMHGIVKRCTPEPTMRIDVRAVGQQGRNDGDLLLPAGHVQKHVTLHGPRSKQGRGRLQSHRHAFGVSADDEVRDGVDGQVLVHGFGTNPVMGGLKDVEPTER